MSRDCDGVVFSQQRNQLVLLSLVVNDGLFLTRLILELLAEQGIARSNRDG